MLYIKQNEFIVDSEETLLERFTQNGLENMWIQTCKIDIVKSEIGKNQINIKAIENSDIGSDFVVESSYGNVKSMKANKVTEKNEHKEVKDFEVTETKIFVNIYYKTGNVVFNNLLDNFPNLKKRIYQIEEAKLNTLYNAKGFKMFYYYDPIVKKVMFDNKMWQYSSRFENFTKILQQKEHDLRKRKINILIAIALFILCVVFLLIVVNMNDHSEVEASTNVNVKQADVRKVVDNLLEEQHVITEHSITATASVNDMSVEPLTKSSTSSKKKKSLSK